MSEVYPGFWRVRVKVGGDDRTKDAWERNEVGVWYGAWTAKDLEDATMHPVDPAEYLLSVPAQRELEWGPFDLTPAFRFRNIPETDWVVVFLKEDRLIGIAQVVGELRSSDSHPLNDNSEVFKYRAISNKKTFSLAKLPDAYQLLPAQGRGNVYQLHNMREHVRLLAESRDEGEVKCLWAQKPFDQLLDLLGASAWESFSLSYLILEEGFLPTGLSTGRTLPDADIIGRRRDGSRIYAQCKKHPTEQSIDPDFVRLSKDLPPSDTAYYFAYGGCTGNIPSNVKVVDRESALKWAESENGTLFRNLVLEAA